MAVLGSKKMVMLVVAVIAAVNFENSKERIMLIY
jgi:hypothetical protein